MQRPQPGVELVFKPANVTSFALVKAVQERLVAMPGRAWKVCHAGALDPFATGLVPVLIGAATKLFELVHELPKTYVATLRWGTETDTGDPGGAVVHTHDASALTFRALDDTLAGFVGFGKQVPPATSNKRVDGERAYEKAHRGEVVELPPSDVYLHSAKWLRHQLPVSSELELVCRGGYYVRSLARDLGRALGCGAHLSTLERRHIGPWSTPDPDRPVAIAGVEAFPWLETLVLQDDEWGALKVSEGTVSVRARPKAAKWPWPRTFPTPPERILAVHQGRGVALLTRAEGGVRVEQLLLPPL